VAPDRVRSDAEIGGVMGKLISSVLVIGLGAACKQPSSAPADLGDPVDLATLSSGAHTARLRVWDLDEITIHSQFTRVVHFGDAKHDVMMTYDRALADTLAAHRNQLVEATFTVDAGEAHLTAIAP
jgi:hypothetical protein